MTTKKRLKSQVWKMGSRGNLNKAMETGLENELVLPPKRISVWLWYWGSRKLLHLSLQERYGSVQFSHSVVSDSLQTQGL